MSDYIQPLRSGFTEVYLYPADSTDELLTARTTQRPTCVINKDDHSFAVFNLFLRKPVETEQDIALWFGFLDKDDNCQNSGEMQAHFKPGDTFFAIAFDISNDAPGLYRVKFALRGTDDPGTVFQYSIINNELFGKKLPINAFSYPITINRQVKNISSAELHGSNLTNNFWNAELLSGSITIESHPFLMFNIFFPAYTTDKNIVLRTVLRDEYGNVTIDYDDPFEMHPGYDRLAKQIILKRDDGSEFYTGKYYAEFSIDDSDPYILGFEIISNEQNQKMAQKRAEISGKVSAPVKPAKKKSFFEVVDNILSTVEAISAVAYTGAELVLTLCGEDPESILQGSQSQEKTNPVLELPNKDDDFDFYRAFDDSGELVDLSIGRGAEAWVSGTGICAVTHNFFGTIWSGPVFILIGDVIYEARNGSKHKPVYVIKNNAVYRALDSPYFVSAPTGNALFYIEGNLILRAYPGIFNDTKSETVEYYVEGEYVYRPYKGHNTIHDTFDGKYTGAPVFKLIP